jgi:hypothetical protein
MFAVFQAAAGRLRTAANTLLDAVLPTNRLSIVKNRDIADYYNLMHPGGWKVAPVGLQDSLQLLHLRNQLTTTLPRRLDAAMEVRCKK